MNLFWRTKSDAVEKPSRQNVSSQTTEEQQNLERKLVTNLSEKRPPTTQNSSDVNGKQNEGLKSGNTSWWKFWQKSPNSTIRKDTKQPSGDTDSKLGTSEPGKTILDTKSEELMKAEKKRLTLEDVPDGEIVNMILTHIGVTTAVFIPFSYITQRFIKYKESKMKTPFTRMNKFLLLSVNLLPVLGFSAVLSGAYILYKYEFEEKSTKMGEYMRQEKLYDDYMGTLIWPIEIPKKHPVKKDG